MSLFHYNIPVYVNNESKIQSKIGAALSLTYLAITILMVVYFSIDFFASRYIIQSIPYEVSLEELNSSPLLIHISFKSEFNLQLTTANGNLFNDYYNCSITELQQLYQNSSFQPVENKNYLCFRPIYTKFSGKTSIDFSIKINDV